MVQANLNDIFLSRENGLESTDLHRRLVLSNPTRDQIRDELVSVAEYYIRHAGGLTRLPDHEVKTDSDIETLQTFKIPYDE